MKYSILRGGVENLERASGTSRPELLGTNQPIHERQRGWIWRVLTFPIKKPAGLASAEQGVRPEIPRESVETCKYHFKYHGGAPSRDLGIDSCQL
jgi:hypothetical protein